MGPCFRMCQIDLTGLVEVACKQTKDFDAAASCFWLPLGLIITAVTWPFDQECFFFGTNTSGSMMTRQYNTGHHIQPFNPRIVSCTFKLTLGTSWHILAHLGTSWHSAVEPLPWISALSTLQQGDLVRPASVLLLLLARWILRHILLLVIMVGPCTNASIFCLADDGRRNRLGVGDASNMGLLCQERRQPTKS